MPVDVGFLVLLIFAVLMVGLVMLYQVPRGQYDHLELVGIRDFGKIRV